MANNLKIGAGLLVATACLTLLLLTAHSRSGVKTVTLFENGKSDFTVIYDADLLDSPDCRTALWALEEVMRQASDGAVSFTSDYGLAAEECRANEILIGNTAREESHAVFTNLRERDFAVGFINEKLTVIGGSSEATATAIRHFYALFFKSERNRLVLREDFHVAHQETYPLDTLSVFGYSHSELGIVYDASTEQDALALRRGIRTLTGYTLPLYTEECPLPFALTLTSEDREITHTDTALILSHGDADVRSERVKALLAKWKAEKVIENTDFPRPRENPMLSLFSLTLYRSGYGANATVNRYPRLMYQLGKNEYPALLALQDVSPAWLAEFGQSGEDYPALNSIYHTVTNTLAEENEAAPMICYRKDTLTLIASDSLLLSALTEPLEEEPEEVLPHQRQLATIATFETRKGGEWFTVISASLDNNNEFARKRAIATLLAYADTLSTPVILAGDFESGRYDPPYLMTTEVLFAESHQLAKDTDGYHGATENGAFGNSEATYYQTDFVFMSYGDFRVYSHSIDRMIPNGGYTSNHWAIITEFSLKTYEK